VESEIGGLGLASIIAGSKLAVLPKELDRRQTFHYPGRQISSMLDDCRFKFSESKRVPARSVAQRDFFRINASQARSLDRPT
jgi:hypothetical protein